MSIDGLITIFLTSLFGSGHCVGMCGGFVALYSLGCSQDSPQVPRREGWARHFLYNGGRLAAYVFLGAIAGALGASLDSMILKHLHLSSAALAGGIILVWGGSMLAISLGWRPGFFKTPRIFSGVQRGIAKIYHSFLSRPGKRSALILGLCTGFLPCGWLYLYVAAAAATSSVSGGVMVMLAFWAGTVPALLLFGGVTSKLSQAIRARIPVFSGVLMVLLGVFTITGRLTPHDHTAHSGSHEMQGHHHHHHAH